MTGILVFYVVTLDLEILSCAISCICSNYSFIPHIATVHCSSVAAPAFCEWGGQGGQDMCKGGHNFFHFVLQPSPSTYPRYILSRLIFT